VLTHESDGVHAVGVSRTKVAPSCDGHACAGPGRRREELDGRGHGAHRLETGVACAMGEIPVDEGRCSHESPRATALREWVPTPMWALRAVYMWLFALRPPAGIQGDIRARECPASRRRPFALVGPRAGLGCTQRARWVSCPIGRGAHGGEHVGDLILTGHGCSCPAFIERGAQWRSPLG
jgi:hypothetical protein